MNETVLLAAAMAASLVGGGLGAHLAGAPVWKGLVLTLVASIVQLAFVEFVPVENAIVSSLVFLAAVGILGGRWGMGLTARQLSLVVIGSFLFALLGAVAAFHLAGGGAT